VDGGGAGGDGRGCAGDKDDRGGAGDE